MSTGLFRKEKKKKREGDWGKKREIIIALVILAISIGLAVPSLISDIKKASGQRERENIETTLPLSK